MHEPNSNPVQKGGKTLENEKCFWCGIFGHFQADCEDLKTQIRIGTVKLNHEGKLRLKDGFFIPKYLADCYMPVHELGFTSFSAIPVTSLSPLSLHLTYRSLSLTFVSLSSVLHSVHHGSIPPLSCSEHHSLVLWLDYLTVTSLHSCG